MTKTLLIQSVITACLWLSGCASGPVANTDLWLASPLKPGPDEAQEQPGLADLSEPQASLEPETLYALLLAEIAGQRKRYDVALGNYLLQAHKTQDVGVAERATRIAQYINAHQAALEAAMLWAELAPEAVPARQAAATELLRFQRYTEALAHMEQILKLGGKPSFDYLAAIAHDQETGELNLLLEAFSGLLADYPQNAQLHYGYGALLKQKDRPEKALKAVEQAIKYEPDYVPGMLLKFQLLRQLEEPQKAHRYLQKAVRRHPEKRQLRETYARLLVDENQLQEAEVQFAKLVEQEPRDYAMRLSYALTAFENRHLAVTQAQLLMLSRIPEYSAIAYYYLGRVAEYDNQEADAIDYYRQVGEGKYYLSARSRLAILLYEAGQGQAGRDIIIQARAQSPDQADRFYLMEVELLVKMEQEQAALGVLSEALEHYPEDVSLMYTRAMTFQKLGQLLKMEQDLRYIIDQEPDNAAALNALGYTLIDQQGRLDEAYELIDKAIRLRPDDPAIIDSMGWINYKKGNLDKALELLQAAYDQFPDPEVAAHLIEVLWVLGRFDAANALKEKYLAEDPDNEFIQQALRRLEALGGGQLE